MNKYLYSVANLNRQITSTEPWLANFPLGRLSHRTILAVLDERSTIVGRIDHRSSKIAVVQLAERQEDEIWNHLATKDRLQQILSSKRHLEECTMKFYISVSAQHINIVPETMEKLRRKIWSSMKTFKIRQIFFVIVSLKRCNETGISVDSVWCIKG